MTEGFSRLVLDYCEYAQKVFTYHTANGVNTPARWIPPAGNIIKLNSDAAILGNGMIGLGVVDTSFWECN